MLDEIIVGGLVGETNLSKILEAVVSCMMRSITRVFETERKDVKYACVF